MITQRNSSPQTIAAYRDTFRLLLTFASQRTSKQPCELDIDDLDVDLIGSFLNHLEQERGNSAPTRNARLAAIHSLYRPPPPGTPRHHRTSDSDPLQTPPAPWSHLPQPRRDQGPDRCARHQHLAWSA